MKTDIPVTIGGEIDSIWTFWLTSSVGLCRDSWGSKLLSSTEMYPTRRARYTPPLLLLSVFEAGMDFLISSNTCASFSSNADVVIFRTS